ncbi:HNH endonuclease [Duganella sp. CY15W]|uniref:HNH endonuclease n=1 Tax=Duganella sp. CY15W TaxID=2692172 RepID=UPI00136D7272|nr:HNH endonuclease signature motif containing protein [Duganella sp. CY15W]MYM31495.1 HNH endonuclease [Duganella sp. CY15W]
MKLSTLKYPMQQLRNTLPVAQPTSWRAGKESSTKRGYGYKWQQARAGYLRSNPLCVYCAQSGRTTEATVVDHRVPHRGDQKLFWSKANWQALCKPCHDGEKQREEARMVGDAIDGDHLISDASERHFIGE